MNPSELIVTTHSINRFRERTGCKKDDNCIANKLKYIVATGSEWEVKPSKRLMQLLMNDCEPARYFRSKGGIMVVVANNVIKTVHKAEAHRWQLKAHSTSSICRKTSGQKPNPR